jgi:hypothetical protein
MERVEIAAARLATVNVTAEPFHGEWNRRSHRL